MSKKKSKPKNNPHIPPLAPERLQIVLQTLQKLDITPEAKRLVENILRAASNPDAESPETLIKGLPEEQRASVTETRKQLDTLFTDVGKRGRKALMDMSDEQWDLLVREAENEG